MILGKSLSKSLGVSLGKSFAGGDTPVVWTGLQFTSTGVSTITLNQVGTYTGTWPIEYALSNEFADENAVSNLSWSAYTLGTIITLNDGDVLLMRGQKDSTAQSGDVYRKFTMSGSIAASGDITSILNNVGGVQSLASFGDWTMYSLFTDCTALTSAPSMPSAVLTTACYYNMYQGCTSLVTVPSLPATALKPHCYQSMFEGCTSLTSALSLPATTLANNCYYGMFKGCSSLAVVPSLPATSLAADCYNAMFYGTAIVTPPSLPATNLADNCYRVMFKNCRLLASVPSLPATTLKVSCYQNMFEGCSSITSAPVLPAETLMTSCYQSMFRNCTSLQSAPVLSATNLAEACYRLMFRGCTSITEAPLLPATTLASSCYKEMFYGCTGITSITLPATSLVASCYNQMFFCCTSLNEIHCSATDISASDCTTNWVLNVAYEGDFYGNVAGWSRGASGIPTNWNVHYNELNFTSTGVSTIALNQVGTYTGTWDIDTSLNGAAYTSYTLGTTINLADGDVVYFRGVKDSVSHPNSVYRKFVMTGSIAASGDVTSLLNNVGGVLDLTSYGQFTFYNLFYGCTSLTSASISLPSTTIVKGSYYNMFNSCEGLVTGPASLPVTDIPDSGIASMFYGCLALTAAPEFTVTSVDRAGCYTVFQGCKLLASAPITLNADVVGNNGYDSMFRNCFALTSVPDVNATTLGTSACSSMFNGCTHLVNPPALPATNLGANCYQSMFQGCISLQSAPTLPSETLANNCYQDMFNGCTSLTEAPSLPATTLAQSCYQEMFYNCTSLVNVPSELPATTLATDCYRAMFYNCTSLVSAPALSATTLASSCYKYMFFNCSLVNTPLLPATTLVENCYQNMFHGCTKLEGPVNIEATSPYYEGTSSACQTMFMNTGTQRVGTNRIINVGGGSVADWNATNCGIDSNYWDVQVPVTWNGLKFTSDGTNTVWLYGEGAWLMDDNEDVTPNPNISHNCEYSLNGGTTWVTMPTTLATAVSFTGTMHVRGNNSAGWGDDSHAPSFRFGGSGHVSVAGNIFSLLDNGAGTITTMPSNSCMPYLFGTKDSWGMDLNTCITDASGLVLPDASQIYSFGCLFRNCPGLVNASFTLPTTIGRSSCYYMFYSCTSLVNAPALPATTLAYGCYSFMFQNCTHLEGPVNISATSPLVSGERACSDMFTNSGTARVGTNRIIYVGGNVSDWNLANCGIDSNYWTPLTGLKFTSDGTNTVYLPKGTWLTEGELPSETNVSQNCQYSLDGTTWSTMPTSPGVAATFTGTMYVRGNNPNGWADDSNFARFTFGGSGHVTLSGSLLSLIDNGAGTATTVPTGTYFVSLFGNGYNASHTLWDPDTCIVDASGLVLNNANVSGGVYASLFRNCQSLILAPALPTITLASFCYQYMFEGCSSLITAPALSATTLAGHCYEGMFRNCTHLEGPVNISANSPRADVNACAFMFINSGIARVGTNRIIYVGGNVSQWNYDNCGIDSNYWTVQ